MPTHSERTLGLLFASWLVAASPVLAQGPDALKIEAQPLPGQLDVLQGTAVELGGSPAGDADRPYAHEWTIVEGEGGHLYRADKPTAIFVAPSIDEDARLFVVQVIARYEGREPAEARLHIVAHREAPVRQPVVTQEQEEEPGAWIDDYYRARREREQQQERGRTVVLPAPGRYPSWHYGFTWGWGGVIGYPAYVPVPLSSGTVLRPGEGVWPEPAPIPFEEIVTTFPEEVADRYLPQDSPLPGRALPVIPLEGSAPAPRRIGTVTVDPGFDVDPIGF